MLAPAFNTTKAFGFSKPSPSASGTTAASRIAGCVISALSTSNGETQMPETLNMDVDRNIRHRLEAAEVLLQSVRAQGDVRHA